MEVRPIPSGWQVKPLKRIAREIVQKEDAKPDGLGYIGLENIESWTGRLIATDEAIDPTGAVSLFKKGDVLFGKLRPYLAKSFIAPVDGVGTSELLVYRPERETDPRFLNYFFLSPQFIDEVNASTYGAKMPRASGDFIGSVNLAVPPLPTQISIADYLDRETAKIDKLIKEKEDLLKLLDERRQALITEAVTRGLDPTVPMKDSGLPWLGEIPAHWDVMGLRWVVGMQSGDGITSDSIEESGTYPVYGGNGLRGFAENYTHEGTYVLIGRQGAQCGNVHVASGRFWASEHAVVVTPRRKLAVTWLAEILRHMDLNQYSVSAAQPGLAVERIMSLQIPVPPIDEQELIGTTLDQLIQSDKILVDLNQEIILRLQNRRSSLIHEAVTGQLRVESQK